MNRPELRIKFLMISVCYHWSGESAATAIRNLI